jgi:UDP-N-acetyl-D-galactosamine dehydrogenase
MKIAEACKVVENTQRDVNIAFMNEISMFLSKLNLNTLDVIAAMQTKWNALPFVPGLVGGHCIGVDPQYLIYRAQEIGCDLELIRKARTVNDNIPQHIAKETISAMCKKKINPAQSRILLMGATFKENCSDIRNARPFDIANELKKYGAKVDMFDPVADKKEVFSEYGFELVEFPKNHCYDAVLLAVAHNQFKRMGPSSIRNFGKNPKFIFYDIKSVFDKKYSDLAL